MKNNVKYLMVVMGILGILLGRIVSRVLESYYGNKASNIVVSASVVIVFCVILALIIMKHYIAAILLLIMVIPLIIGGIGLYLNNMLVASAGVLLIFIIYPILLKVIPRLKHFK